MRGYTKREGVVLDILTQCDWDNVFAYANPEKALPNDDISTESFTTKDVTEIFGCDLGENNGANWVMAGLLKDGRYFFISAGCDYTGWG